jgi:hypothetical protein
VVPDLAAMTGMDAFRTLAETAHAHGLPLLTDDAWGLDYSFCTRLPPSAIDQMPGYDLMTDDVDYFEQLAAAGVMVEGAADETLEHLRVVAR